MAGRKVVFARINRRRTKQGTLEMRPFAEDIARLVESRKTTYHQPGEKTRPPREWFAADLRLTPHGDYLVGTLGFSEAQQQRRFDQVSWSWLKGETSNEVAGSEQTVVPFAVNLAEHGRWASFGSASRMTPLQCRAGLEHVLREAVFNCGLLPAEWDVDLVTSRSQVAEWLERYPRVRLLLRTLKFSNPGLDLDGDREDMRALGANRKTEEYAAYRGGVLDTSGADFQRKLDGVERGDVEIQLTARTEEAGGSAVFKSKDRPDEVLVDDWGLDLERGMDAVLHELQKYVATLPEELRARLETE